MKILASSLKGELIRLHELVDDISNHHFFFIDCVFERDLPLFHSHLFTTAFENPNFITFVDELLSDDSKKFEFYLTLIHDTDFFYIVTSSTRSELKDILSARGFFTNEIWTFEKYFPNCSFNMYSVCKYVSNRGRVKLSLYHNSARLSSKVFQSYQDYKAFLDEHFNSSDFDNTVAVLYTFIKFFLGGDDA